MKLIFKIGTLVVAATLIMGMITPGTAITKGGVLDGEDHPFVGLLIFEAHNADGALVGAWRCSGTLLSPTVMLTAGHCTDGADAGRVWFDSEVLRGDPLYGYPFTGGVTSIEFDSMSSHPNYDPNAFYLHDAGIVHLAEAVNDVTFGELPDVGYFDDIMSEPAFRNNYKFTPVGYGLQWANSGVNTQQDLIRMRALVSIINSDQLFSPGSSDSILFTNNAHGGGTCFGDSGGPIFVEGTNVVAAVTSFGLNSECGGTGGGYRMDVLDAQDFVAANL